MILNGRVGSSPSTPTKNLKCQKTPIVTLPITLPQRQAYASNKGWQGYGSKQISFRAALKAARTCLSRKHPGLANSLEIDASLG